MVKVLPPKTIKIRRDQAWFWTPEWQDMEREADQDLLNHDYKDFTNLEALLKDLHSIKRSGSGIKENWNP